MSTKLTETGEGGEYLAVVRLLHLHKELAAVPAPSLVLQVGGLVLTARGASSWKLVGGGGGGGSGVEEGEMIARRVGHCFVPLPGPGARGRGMGEWDGAGEKEVWD